MSWKSSIMLIARSDQVFQKSGKMVFSSTSNLRSLAGTSHLSDELAIVVDLPWLFWPTPAVSRGIFLQNHRLIDRLNEINPSWSYEFACLIIPMQSCKHQQWAPKLVFLSSPSIPQVQNIDPLILKRPWASADLFSCLLVPPVLFHRQLQVGHVAHLLSVGSIITHENLGELQMETGMLPNTWQDLARPSFKKENKDEWLVTPIFTPWKKLRHKSPRSHGEEEIAERLQAMPFRVTPAIGVQLCGRQT